MPYVTNRSQKSFLEEEPKNPQSKSKLDLQQKNFCVFVNKGTPFLQSVVSLNKFLLSDRVLMMSCIL